MCADIALVFFIFRAYNERYHLDGGKRIRARRWAFRSFPLFWRYDDQGKIYDKQPMTSYSRIVVTMYHFNLLFRDIDDVNFSVSETLEQLLVAILTSSMGFAISVLY